MAYGLEDVARPDVLGTMRHARVTARARPDRLVGEHVLSQAQPDTGDELTDVEIRVERLDGARTRARVALDARRERRPARCRRDLLPERGTVRSHRGADHDSPDADVFPSTSHTYNTYIRTHHFAYRLGTSFRGLPCRSAGKNAPLHTRFIAEGPVDLPVTTRTIAERVPRIAYGDRWIEDFLPEAVPAQGRLIPLRPPAEVPGLRDVDDALLQSLEVSSTPDLVPSLKSWLPRRYRGGGGTNVVDDYTRPG